MNRTFPKRSLVALALALALVLGTVPSYAVTVPAVVPVGSTVPSHAKIGARDLFGLTDAEARAAISTGTVMPAFKSFKVYGDGHTVTVSGKAAILLNVNGMLEKAYAATDTVTPFELAPAYTVKSGIIASYTALLAKRVNHKPTNAQRKLKGKRLIVTKEFNGHVVTKKTTGARIRAALYSEMASPTTTPKVYAALKTTKPKVTRKNIPKAIIVVLHEFRIRLYKGTKTEKTYRCAIGQPAYPTPTGKFKVTGKVKNPVWHNPYSSWSKNMPATIRGGVNNPLGTRAIYISAPGIRMHGIPASENWSIGHRASHGCMRMKRHDAEDFYPRVPVGITVWIVK